jgi:hypothetical protein
VDYEYRLSPDFGVGALVDHAWGHPDATVAAAAVFVHPWRGLRLLAAPGIEYSHGEGEFLIRVGAAYEFHRGSWTVAPTVNVDFVDGDEALVYGLTFGYGF